MLFDPFCVEDLYSDDRRVWNALLRDASMDLATAEREGVDLGWQGKIYPIVLGNKGDWSYLVSRICSLIAFKSIFLSSFFHNVFDIYLKRHI